MKKLAEAEITMNCQVVLCPGVNDGEELRRTVYDLIELYPYVNSIAVVPVGITKYRDNLPNLKIFDKESANKTIDQIHKIQEDLLKKVELQYLILLRYYL